MTPSDSSDVYLGVVERLEPELTAIDRDAALASIAISLKRIADVMEAGGGVDTEALRNAIERAIWSGLSALKDKSR